MTQIKTLIDSVLELQQEAVPLREKMLSGDVGNWDDFQFKEYALVDLYVCRCVSLAEAIVDKEAKRAE